MSDDYGPLPARCYVVRIGGSLAVGFTLRSALGTARARAGDDATTPRYAICCDTAFFVPGPVERLRDDEWHDVPDGIGASA